MGSNNFTIVNTKELANTLGVTARYVNKLAKMGILEKHGRDSFPLEPNVAQYIEYQKDGEGPEARGLKESYWQEKAKHERTLRQIAEIGVGKAQGKLHDEASIEHVMTNVLITFRNKLLSVPSKIAPVLVGAKTIEEARKALEGELCESLGELKNYGPAMFAGQEEVERE